MKLSTYFKAGGALYRPFLRASMVSDDAIAHFAPSTKFFLWHPESLQTTLRPVTTERPMFGL